MRSALIHGVLLAIMLVYGYRTWTPDKTVKPNIGNVVLWDKSEADFVALEWKTDTKIVRIERRDNSFWWGVETSITKVAKPVEPPANAGSGAGASMAASMAVASTAVSSPVSVTASGGGFGGLPGGGRRRFLRRGGCGCGSAQQQGGDDAGGLRAQCRQRSCRRRA